MVDYPVKIRVSRRRDEVILELKVPTIAGSWYTRERINLGALPLGAALRSLGHVDLTKHPLIKAVVVGPDVGNIP
jgi:hypothetical protein